MQVIFKRSRIPYICQEHEYPRKTCKLLFSLLSHYAAVFRFPLCLSSAFFIGTATFAWAINLGAGHWNGQVESASTLGAELCELKFECDHGLTISKTTYLVAAMANLVLSCSCSCSCSRSRSFWLCSSTSKMQNL